MQRRLPVFFVMDVSESMIGEDLQNLESGMGKIVKSLRGDAHALETVHVSVIAFAGIARVLVPLTDLTRFYAPRLPVGSGTSLGAALTLLMDEIDRNVQRRSATQRGDYKPVVYLMTDGRPTDDVEAAITRWEQHYFQRVTLVAVAIGQGADHGILNRLTDNLVVFDKDSVNDFDPVIRWLTMSISAQSQRVESGGVSLAKPESGMALWLGNTLKASQLDTQVVLLPALCAERKLRYLIRYQVVPLPPGYDGPPMYRATGSHCVTPEYDEWSGQNPIGATPTISTSMLGGSASCPACGAPFGLATCGGCGRVHCVRGDGAATCPHCGKAGNYVSAEDGDPGSDVARGRG